MTKDALKQLYPFLSEDSGATDKSPDNESLLQALTEKAEHSAQTKLAFIEQNGQTLIDAAQAMAKTFAAGGKLLCMGNGGSSCDASHLAVEFNHPVSVGRPPLPAVNLAADTAMLTATSNDVGYALAFQRQVMALGRAGDTLVGLSTSGESENLCQAFTAAKNMGLTTVAFIGGDGSKLRALGVDHILCVPGNNIHRIQESHVLAYHCLWDVVHSLLAKRL
ncbi:D-sedoheptulose 7-phosphate isomerase [Litorivivens lipolytica]|uniref:D-sedoheptulose 7-phosphate isomerase n=1 Tax=Litorivivens lipolytica TaxID=1524264 RepID=A0A7W4W3P4_9GAMM|nr:SIS domain-containing protein [Litorivivens lipolytica]MBB3046866.1 D-sedoheptulose 7-phosphate isomerase [Litorivivens lipolytica]